MISACEGIPNRAQNEHYSPMGHLAVLVLSKTGSSSFGLSLVLSKSHSETLSLV